MVEQTSSQAAAKTEGSTKAEKGGVELAWFTLNHIQTTIQLADNKATAVIGIQGIVVGFMLTGVTQVAFRSAQNPIEFVMSPLEKALLVAILTTMVVSIFCALLCLISRYGLSQSFRRVVEPRIVRPASTKIFFGAIAALDRQKYIESMQEMDETSWLEDVAGQIHTLAVIAAEKHRWLNRGLFMLALTLIFLAILGGAVLY
jgi:hypothetical protein